MTQGEAFVRVFITIVLIAGGIRECRRANWSVGTVLLAAPIAAWVSWLFVTGE